MSTVQYTPTTELEAINAILATISEAPLNTLVGELPHDAAMAQGMLHNHSRRIQVRGWSFNTDTSFTLYPNEDGEVVLPLNALVVTVPSNPALVVRGQKLYDTTGHSYEIGAEQSADIIWFLPFEELPEHARALIFASAGRQFQDQVLGDASLHQFTAQDVLASQVGFMTPEAANKGLNAATGAPSIRRIRNSRNLR